MRDLVLMSRDGNFQELVVDYDLTSLEEIWNVNDDRDISLEIPITERNELVYEKMLPDMILDWFGQFYSIITCDEELKGNQRIKKVEAKHIFMESQNVYIERDFSKDKLNDDDYNTDDNGVIQDDNTSTPNEDIEGGQGNSNIDVVADKVYSFLSNRGMPSYQIFGILGNMKAESNMDPAAEQIPGDYDRGGKGLIQWDDRKYNLYDYAARQGKSWQDPDLQIQFMWYELNGSENAAYKRLQNTKNTRDAALIFHRYYERSADTPQMEKRRVNYALEYQKWFESGGYNNDEIFNSDWLDLSKGINYGFGSGGAYEQETGAHRHDGIDINYIYEPVYSVAKGIATTGFDPNGYGNYVMIDASNGLRFIYGHLSEIDVSTNQQIYTGTQLGISGNTGFSTGPHLHFEIQLDGKAFDPMDWIEQNKGGTTSDEDTGGIDTGTEESKDLYSLQSYLDTGFKDNKLGFTFEIRGDFPNYKEVEKIGDKNLLQHIVDGSEIFDYVYYADNKHIVFYDRASFYELEDQPIIYQYNSDELTVKTSITDLQTYIEGYGGKKSVKDTKNYNPIRVKDLQYKGVFDKTGTWSTDRVGASYQSNFVAKYGNEVLQWSLKKGKLGGRVAVYLDDEKINEFNMYSETSATDKVILKRGLEKGKHTLRVEFLGGVNGVDYEDKEPVMYVQTEKSEVINLTAVLQGKEVYNFYADYKSPTAYDTYSFRPAPTVYADKVESLEELQQMLVEKLNDTPTVEVTTNYLDYDKIKPNSKVRLVHKPMGFNTDVEVVGLKKFHPALNKKAEVTFTNNRTDILNYQRRLNRAINQMNMGGY